ncbi:MAG: ribonuclease P protein component [Negativicutes bacterium]|nr:ribonuclease P protein component [Negativicutes bacterium]
MQCDEGLKRRVKVQSFKFSKDNILRQNRQFQAVYKSGKSYANRFLVLYVLPRPSAKRQVGFAVGKRLGGAVVRNRVKRLLREAFRLNQHRFKSGMDLVLIARQPVLHLEFADVVKALLDVAGKANILAE